MSRLRPILFSGPMVRALLAGTKTQTRRIAKNVETHGKGTRLIDVERDARERRRFLELCPYGVAGDRLWVRERIQRIDWEGMPNGVIAYSADGECAWDVTQPCAWGWKRSSLPSMHMPRGLSRIKLEVTEVRVERLQDISDGDAAAEGIAPMKSGGHPAGDDVLSYREQFRELWNGINGGVYPWHTDPWVWVLSFRRLEP